MSLDEALKVVKLAGYRVTKPKPKKQTRVGPTCVVAFSDGNTCRMTTACSDDKPDFRRGIKLCRDAWEIRTGYWREHDAEMARLAPLRFRYEQSLIRKDRLAAAFDAMIPGKPDKVVPEVTSVHFERDGEVIARFEPQQAAA